MEFFEKLLCSILRSTVLPSSDGCIGVHADAAIKAGATREEVAATLATAISLNAGAAYIYSLRALEAYDTLKPAPQS